MARTELLDELHLSLFVSPDSTDRSVQGMRRTLFSKGFIRRLRRAVLAAVREHRSLRRLRLTISR